MTGAPDAGLDALDAALTAVADFTLTDGALTITATPPTSERKRPSIRASVDGATVHLDVLDLASATSRKRFAAALAAEHRDACARLLLQLVDRVPSAPPPAADADDARTPLVDDSTPWPDAVDPAVVLDQVVTRIAMHVVLPSAHHQHAIAAWILLTHAIDAVDTAPVLELDSPSKGCGKTTAQQIVSLLAARALSAENASLAALFRVAEMARPTIILDEIDSWLTGDRRSEIGGFLNASVTRGGRFLRTTGEDHEPSAFNVFGPRCIAGIRVNLPDSTRSRCIRITLQRAPAGALPTPLRPSRATTWADPLRQQLARAAKDLTDEIKGALDDDVDAMFPPGLDGRARDMWSSLLAIGHAVGGVWRDRMIAACAAMTSTTLADDAGASAERLLQDIRAYFGEHAGPVEPTTLAAWLIAQPELPWAEYRHGKPLTARALSVMLQGFGIASKSARVGNRKCRSFDASMFADAWQRYGTLVPAVNAVREPAPATPASPTTDDREAIDYFGPDALALRDAFACAANL